MTEKLIHTLPPTTALPPFVIFGDCKKGETAAKTGCTPASGEGSKKPSSGWDEVDNIEAAASKMDIDADLREEILEDLFTDMAYSNVKREIYPSADSFEFQIETYREEVAGFESRLESLKESGGPPGSKAAEIGAMEQAIEMEEEKIEALGKLQEASGYGSGKEEAPAAEETGGEGKGSQQEQFSDLLKAEDEAFSDEAYTKSFHKAVEKYKPIKTEEKLVSAAWEVERSLESTNEENNKKIGEGKVAEIDLEKISDLNEEANHLNRWIKDVKEQGGFRGTDADTGEAEWSDDHFPIMRLLSAPSKVKGPHLPKSPFAK